MVIGFGPWRTRGAPFGSKRQGWRVASAGTKSRRSGASACPARSAASPGGDRGDRLVIEAIQNTVSASWPRRRTPRRATALRCPRRRAGGPRPPRQAPRRSPRPPQDTSDRFVVISSLPWRAFLHPAQAGRRASPWFKGVALASWAHRGSSRPPQGAEGGAAARSVRRGPGPVGRSGQQLAIGVAHLDQLNHAPS